MKNEKKNLTEQEREAYALVVDMAGAPTSKKRTRAYEQDWEKGARKDGVEK